MANETMTINKVFSGRVIFDHLAKTAGQAINKWLRESIGYGCVTQNLKGKHRKLIEQYGGLYPIISGHVHFHNSEGLDPRYQYITQLRDPVDRVVSWVYFVYNNHTDYQLPQVRQWAKVFLDSNGLEIPEGFLGSVSNCYVEHFCRVYGLGTESNDEKLANALAAIKQYDVVGFYEAMPEFLAEVATLIGIQIPEEITPVNVTKLRPKVDEIPQVMRDRILELNQLDIRFYAEVLAWKSTILKSKSKQDSPISTTKWIKYETEWNKAKQSNERVITTEDLKIVNAEIREGFDIQYGQSMIFDVDFIVTREISDLNMGIHIFDSKKNWAYGTNSKMLGQSHKSISEGSYRVSHHITANLPAGNYTAGFAFVDTLTDGIVCDRELAWQDVMCKFQIFHKTTNEFVGYSNLKAEMNLYPFTEMLPEKVS